MAHFVPALINEMEVTTYNIDAETLAGPFSGERELKAVSYFCYRNDSMSPHALSTFSIVTRISIGFVRRLFHKQFYFTIFDFTFFQLLRFEVP